VLRTLATPKWVGLTVLALVLIVAMGALSWWQWQRAHRDEVAAIAPVAVGDVLSVDAAPPADRYGTRVEASGTYDLAHQVLVDNGDGTYWVMTPLRPASGPAVPVARGVVTSRTDPAASSAPSGTVRVVGLAEPFEGDSGVSASPGDGVVGALTASALALPYPAVQGWVALESQEPVAATMPPVPAPFGAPSAGLRIQNAGYAVQWLAFASFVGFLWWRMLREDLRAPSGTPGVEPSSAPEVY